MSINISNWNIFLSKNVYTVIYVIYLESQNWLTPKFRKLVKMIFNEKIPSKHTNFAICKHFANSNFAIASSFLKLNLNYYLIGFLIGYNSHQNKHYHLTTSILSHTG